MAHRRDDAARVSRPHIDPDDAVATPQALSIVDFLTDGALAAFLAETSALLGSAISLRSVTGASIEASAGDPPWIVHEPLPGDEDVARAIELAGAGGGLIDLAPSGVLAPLTARGRSIGALFLAGEPTPRLRHMIELLASMISDLCTRERLLQARHDELQLLFRVSSLFVTAQKLEHVLEITLQAADRVLGADAAIVHLHRGDSPRLQPIAHVGLSPGFIERFDANNAPRAKDPALNEGRAIAVPELRSIGSPAFARLFEEEGLSSMLACGLVHRGRSLGAVRLFRRSASAFSREQQALLQTLAEQIASALSAAEHAEQERQAERMHRQLQIASDVQRRLLPADRLAFAGVDLAARYVSAGSVSGDFYDVLELGEHVGLVVGDVVGKGVPAALLMASVRSLFRAHALDLKPDEHLVNEVVRRVNVTLTRDTLPSEFATAFFGTLDASRRVLTYCSAGHDPPLLFRQDALRKPPIRLDRSGALLGVDETHTFERAQVQLQAGDTLVVYSDGVTDAMNYEHRKFGRTRLTDSVRDQLLNFPASSARDIVERVVWDVRRFVGLNTAENDDLTVLVARV